MVEAGIVAASFGCENAIVDVSILEEEESLDCSASNLDIGKTKGDLPCLIRSPLSVLSCPLPQMSLVPLWARRLFSSRQGHYSCT